MMETQKNTETVIFIKCRDFAKNSFLQCFLPKCCHFTFITKTFCFQVAF